MVVKLFEGKRRPFLSVLQRLSRGQSRSKHGASAVMRFRMLRLGTRGLLAYQMRGHSWLCMKIVVVLLVVPVPHAYWTELCKLARRALSTTMWTLPLTEAATAVYMSHT